MSDTALDRLADRILSADEACEVDRTIVVHCRQSAYDVYIGRPSVWGNPFRVGRDGTRDEVIAKYATWVLQQSDLMAQISTLRGRVLGCWCAPKACHGDVLARLADLESI